MTCSLVAAIAGLSACAVEDSAPATVMPPFTVIEGVSQLTVIDAQPETPLTLYDPAGAELVTLITDIHGQAHFAYLPNHPAVLRTGLGLNVPVDEGRSLQPGEGYTIRYGEAPTAVTGALRVLAVDDHPPVSLYERQRIDAGLNYLEMRDGILLGASVWMPDPVLCGLPPYPTVVEYSGYSPSRPDDPDPGSYIANILLCYVSVGVNMRGTACSGGVFDVFNPAQHADGYDIIEIVGRQPFVLHNKVGMVGLSYPGIAQLYVAYTNPPHLAAITPLSVIEDPWLQAWPGGIYNNGFTQQWLAARDRYAASGGADWSQRLIDAGDLTCAANQKLRTQNVNFGAFSKAISTFPPDAGDRRLGNLVQRIDVPVFLTGAWQDEQTGSRFATMLDNFDNAPVKRFTMFNGRHPDGYTPLTLTRWAEFLDFYVARKIPFINPALRFVDEPLLEEIFGGPGLSFGPDRFTGFLGNYEAALTSYEAEPDVRILFESGNGNPDYWEAPIHRFEKSFATWPPPAVARDWYLGPDGTLLDAPPAAPAPGDDGVDAYRHDPAAGEISFLRDDGLYLSVWDWQPAAAGYALAYLAEPFEEDTLVVGNGGYVTLWFASDSTEANVEVSVLEVREDGTEFLVQIGVFALKHRLSVDEERSGEFLVEYTYAADTMRPLSPGEFVEVRVPIQPFSHAFRAGTRLRLVIDTPGRDHAFWEFINPPYGSDVILRVARTPLMPSSIRLPTITGTTLPDPAPPCGSLRGVICRFPFLDLPNDTVPD